MEIRCRDSLQCKVAICASVRSTGLNRDVDALPEHRGRLGDEAALARPAPGRVHHPVSTAVPTVPGGDSQVWVRGVDDKQSKDSIQMVPS